MENYLVLPIALQLCLDDIGWHKGDDDRTIGQPSRTGIPRMHAPEDYHAINELGRALDMKIIGPLCLGEWDKDNLLRGEVGITHNPHGWDRKSEINYDMAAKYFEALNGAEYIEFAVHGLMHGQYDENGKQINENEYFILKNENGKSEWHATTLSDLNRRLDLFFKIYDSWGFKRKIRTIVSPGGVTRAPLEELLPFAEEFKRRGFDYWPNGWYPQITGAHMLMRGVFCMRETGAGVIPWNAYDYDPDMLLEIAPLAIETGRSVFGAHWPNFLRYNPKRSKEHLPAWIAYFKRQAEYFGCMLSRDVAFAANQEIHATYSKVECYPDKCVIDTEGAHLLGFDKLESTFYVSIKKDKVPKALRGGNISLYEEHNDFNTYKIEYKERKLELLFGE